MSDETNMIDMGEIYDRFQRVLNLNRHRITLHASHNKLYAEFTDHDGYIYQIEAIPIFLWKTIRKRKNAFANIL